MNVSFLRTKAWFEIFLMVSLSFVLSVTLSSSLVTADDVASNPVCCEKTKGGDYCQYTDQSNCDTSVKDPLHPAIGNYKLSPTSCDEAAFCQPGCCDLNQNHQGCFKNVGKSSCDAQGGKFKQDASCGYPECQLGCCVLGGQCAYSTPGECQSLFDPYKATLTYDFRPDVPSELACSQVCLQKKKGCCIKTDGSCSGITGEECAGAGGTFSESLCSKQPSGQCDSCKVAFGEERKKTCVDGDPNVYYADNCGNTEEVAASCNYPASKCVVNSTGVGCKDLSCHPWAGQPEHYNKYTNLVRKDEIPQTISNGESWCQYDFNVGPGTDLPGSRHWKQSCQEGEEIAEPGVDYRGQVCVEVQLKPEDGGLRSAVWVNNKAADCAKCTDKYCCQNRETNNCLWVGTDQAAVDKIKDTDRKKINVTAGDKVEQTGNPDTYGYCIPLVPPGKSDFCGQASRTVSTPVKAPETSFQSDFGNGYDWECKGGCVAYTLEYGKQQNNLCKSYGDCGAGYSLAAEWSQNGFKRTCKGTEGENGLPGDAYSDLDNGDLGSDVIPSEFHFNGDSKKLVNDCTTYLPTPRSSDTDHFSNRWGISSNILTLKNFDLGILTQNFGWKGRAASLVGAGLVTASAISFFTALGATTEGFIVVSAGIGSANIWNPVGWAIFVVLAIVAIALVILSFSSSSYTFPVATTCNAWQPPASGTYCGLCNGPGKNALGQDVDFTAGGTHPCTPYLCQSLGSGCQYNAGDQGAEGGLCTNTCDGANRPGAPFIRLDPKTAQQFACLAGSEEVTRGQQPVSCQDKVQKKEYGYDLAYVHPKTAFTLTVQTCKDPDCTELLPSQCVIDKQQKPFEEMGQFIQSGIYTSFNITYKPGDLIEGNLTRLYVRCQNVCGDGKEQLMEVNVNVAKGVDVESPRLLSIDPVSGALLPALGNQTQVMLTLNEAVGSAANQTCRYDSTEKDYKQMTGLFSCPVKLEGQDQVCHTQLSNLTLGENKLFITCQDLHGNINRPSLIPGGYTLVKTQALNISTVTCNGKDCQGTFYSPNITLQVSTNGGASQGISRCGFARTPVFNVDDALFTFPEESAGHSLTVTSQALFNYTLTCQDKAHNLASVPVSFMGERDTTPPKLLQTQVSGGILSLKTDEAATCTYSVDRIFSSDNATAFTETGGMTHSVPINEHSFFTVSCHDAYANSFTPVRIYLV